MSTTNFIMSIGHFKTNRPGVWGGFENISNGFSVMGKQGEKSRY